MDASAVRILGRATRRGTRPRAGIRCAPPRGSSERVARLTTAVDLVREADPRQHQPRCRQTCCRPTANRRSGATPSTTSTALDGHHASASGIECGRTVRGPSRRSRGRRRSRSVHHISSRPVFHARGPRCRRRRGRCSSAQVDLGYRSCRHRRTRAGATRPGQVGATLARGVRRSRLRPAQAGTDDQTLRCLLDGKCRIWRLRRRHLCP